MDSAAVWICGSVFLMSGNFPQSSLSYRECNASVHADGCRCIHTDDALDNEVKCP